MENNILKQLCDLKLVNEEDIFERHPRVRDREDITVLQDKKTHVICLSKSDHMDLKHYEDQDSLQYWSADDREDAKKSVEDDDKRRSKQFRDVILGKKWLDCGTGAGGILDLLKNDAKEVYAIEPQNNIREELKKAGYKVYSSIESCDIKNFDVVTLFHVAEHFSDPLGALKGIHEMLVDGGKIIVEVPHAQDALLSLFNLESFKNFTFWSEHLILHTRKSIMTFLKEAGFKNIRIEGFQRYPLSNHLYWILKGKPGGHKKWSHLRVGWIENVYESILKTIDKTDTIIAYGEK